jgi:hypothetical protein
MKINPTPPTDWNDLQKQTARNLEECGLNTAIEKTITTSHGTVDVDVHAEDSQQTPSVVCLCECKHWTNPVPKGVVRDFRTVMQDFGANVGYLISKAGFQSGSRETAKFTNIKLFTWEEFETEWMERWVDTYLRPRLGAASDLLFMYIDPFIGNNLSAKLDAVTKEKQKEFFDIRHTPQIELPFSIGSDYGGPLSEVGHKRKLLLPFSCNRPEDNQNVPPQLLKTESLREFGDIITKWAEESKRKLDTVLTP